MTEIEERIIELVAEKMAFPRGRIELSTTLQDDVGMDGDDASEFFAEFAKIFPGDYSELQDHWHVHFGPESTFGFPGWIFPAAGVAGVLAAIFHDWIPWIPAWFTVPAFAIAMLVACLKIHAVLHPNLDLPIRPITIQDLVDAATTRKWPLTYSTEESRLPSYWPSVVPLRE